MPNPALRCWVAALALASAAGAAEPASPTPTPAATPATTPPAGPTSSQAAGAVSEIAPGVHLLRGMFVPGQQPDGNTVLFTAPDGLIVVDTGRHAAHTRQILAFAADRKLPLRAIVNTHWHLDHVAGNALLRREAPDVAVWSSGAIDGALTGFLANSRRQLEEMLRDPQLPAADAAAFRDEIERIDAGPLLAPTERVTAAGRRTLAGRELVFGLTDHAVTAADVWLFDPATRVLVAGDLVTLPAPFLDTACPAHWQATLAELMNTNFALLVPGHGPVMNRAQVATYQRAFTDLVACATAPGATGNGSGAAEAAKASKQACIEGWITDLGALLPESEHRFTRAMVDYYVDQHLRGDPARNARLCGEAWPAAAAPSPTAR